MNQLRTHKKRNRIASLIIGASLPFVSFTSACTGIVPPNFSDSLGLVPQFNLITLPGQQD
jgi:hypothetical protein